MLFVVLFNKQIVGLQDLLEHLTKVTGVPFKIHFERDR